MRFFHLKTGQWFTIGKLSYEKTGFFSAQDLRVVPRKYLISPWRRVRTAQPVKRPEIVGQITKALMKTSPFMNIVKGSPPMTDDYCSNVGKLPYTDRAKTHFVGDDCPGGHHEVPTGIKGENVQNMSIPHGDEPHNCNNITGPTC